MREPKILQKERIQTVSFQNEPSPEEIQQISEKKKVHGLDLYVIFSISALIIYTIVSQIMVVTVRASLDILTTCFFGFFGGEIVTCALIKIFKLRDEKTGNNGGGVG